MPKAKIIYLVNSKLAYNDNELVETATYPCSSMDIATKVMLACHRKNQKKIVEDGTEPLKYPWACKENEINHPEVSFESRLVQPNFCVAFAKSENGMKFESCVTIRRNVLIEEFDASDESILLQY